MRQTRAVACPATHNRDMTRWDRPSNQIGPARMLSCSLAIRGKPHPTLEQGSRVVWLNIRRTKYYLVAPLQRSATIDQPGTTCPRVTRISRRRNQVTPTVSILIRSITCHNLIATCGVPAPPCPTTKESSVCSKGAENRQEKYITRCTAPTGQQLAFGNDPIVNAFSKHSRPCPMHAELSKAVCVLGLSRTSNPNVHAAHVALSLPYAMRLDLTPVGVRPVPLCVSVGHHRGSDHDGGETRTLTCQRRPPKIKLLSSPGRHRCCQILLLVSHCMSPTSNRQIYVQLYINVFFSPFGILVSSVRGFFLVLLAPWHTGSPPGPNTQVWVPAEVRGTCAVG